MEGLGVDPAFWRGRRVLVTGHTGFKGSWLTLWLHELGAQVAGLSNGVPTTSSLFEHARVGEGVPWAKCDIRDLQAVERAMDDTRAEIVIHMAAQSLVRRSFAQPVETYATNVMGTVHVLDAARRSESARVVVNVTSDKCYENREWLWGYREDEPKGGHDPYSSSKGCAELVTSAFRRSYAHGDRPAIGSARAGNAIGGGDWSEDRLIPDLMRAVLEHRPAVIRNPDAIRPWQHVLNPLSGYLLLAQALWESPAGHAEGWNFGPEETDARTVAWIIEQLGEALGEPIEWEAEPAVTPHEAHYLKLDSSKARARLGWAPTWGLEDALKGIASWAKTQQAGGDVRRHTLDQIAAFQVGEPPPGPGS